MESQQRDVIRAMLVSAIDRCLADNPEEAVLIIESVLTQLSLMWRNA